MDREVEQSLLRDREWAQRAAMNQMSHQEPPKDDNGLTMGDWIAISMAMLGVLLCVGAAVAWAAGWIE